ncbi:MAG: hypothetical protein LBH98_08890 [Chitinispirillales bacterium]|nr:hypothetical protein [Chitinispirillales bacterium]
MKFLSPFFLLFLIIFLIFAQDEIEEIEYFPNTDISQSVDSSNLQDSEILLELENNETTEITFNKKNKKHKHIVINAITMMLFVGLCITSVSSINPE